MMCPKCGKSTVKGFTTDVTDIDNMLIIVRHVPCYICERCGEVMYTGDVVRILERIVNRAKSTQSELSIIEYKDAA